MYSAGQQREPSARQAAGQVAGGARAHSPMGQPGRGLVRRGWTPRAQGRGDTPSSAFTRHNPHTMLAGLQWCFSATAAARHGCCAGAGPLTCQSGPRSGQPPPARWRSSRHPPRPAGCRTAQPGSGAEHVVGWQGGRHGLHRRPSATAHEPAGNTPSSPPRCATFRVAVTLQECDAHAHGRFPSLHRPSARQ